MKAVIVSFLFGVAVTVMLSSILSRQAPESIRKYEASSLVQEFRRTPRPVSSTEYLEEPTLEDESGDEAIDSDIRSLASAYSSAMLTLSALTIEHRDLEKRLPQVAGQDDQVASEREELMGRPPVRMQFNNVRLSDLFRVVADETGLPFVQPEATPQDMNTLVTIDRNAAPFEILETLAIAYGFVLVRKAEFWTLEAADPGGVRAALERIAKLEESKGRPATDKEVEDLVRNGPPSKLENILAEYTEQ